MSEIIYGRNPVLEALKEGRELSKVFLQQGTRGELEKDLRRLCKASNVPLSFVPRIKLDKMVRANHQGVVAMVSPMHFHDIENLVPSLFDEGKNPSLVVLDGVTDVRNAGAIARSAEVLGAHALVLTAELSGMLNEDAVKSSAGALLRLPVCRVKSLANTLDYLSASGIQLIAADLRGDKSVSEVDMTEPIAVLLGSEGNGLSRTSLERADTRFIIPQSGETDSLNVSVSCGIILYEVSRQRNANF